MTIRVVPRPTSRSRAALLAGAVALALAVTLSGCGATVVGTAGAANSSTTTTGEGALHAMGFPLPRGATVPIPDDGYQAPVTMHVGDVFEATPGPWWAQVPLNRADMATPSQFILAEITPTALTYQATSPGTVVLEVGPVGHPGNCTGPGCPPDATAPPSVRITVLP